MTKHFLFSCQSSLLCCCAWCTVGRQPRPRLLLLLLQDCSPLVPSDLVVSYFWKVSFSFLKKAFLIPWICTSSSFKVTRDIIGTVQWDFWPPAFWSFEIQPFWATYQMDLCNITILFKISLSYSNFLTSRRGMINNQLWRVQIPVYNTNTVASNW